MIACVLHWIAKVLRDRREEFPHEMIVSGLHFLQVKGKLFREDPVVFDNPVLGEATEFFQDVDVHPVPRRPILPDPECRTERICRRYPFLVFPITFLKNTICPPRLPRTGTDRRRRNGPESWNWIFQTFLGG